VSASLNAERVALARSTLIHVQNDRIVRGVAQLGHNALKSTTAARCDRSIDLNMIGLEETVL